MLFAVERRLFDVATLAQRAAEVTTTGRRALGPDFYLTLPYPVLDRAFGPPTTIHLLLVAVGACEALVLFALYRVLRERASTPVERGAIAVAAAALVLIALGAKTLDGFDLYAYLGYAKLPSVQAAYVPPAVRLPGAFGVANDAWGTPLLVSPYGPLWIALVRLVAGGASTVGSALFAFRLLELVPFGAIVALLALRREGVFVALFALNPAIYQLYLANAHSDLLGIAVLLCAFTLARRAPLAAALLVALAGLLKLPLAAFALLVFAGRDKTAVRAGWVGLALALIVAGSLLLAGPAYVHNLIFRLHEVHQQSGLNELTGRVIKTALLLVALAALGVAFFRATLWRAASWSFVALSFMVYPWYLAWSLPYAYLQRAALAAFLILCPLAAAMLDIGFPSIGLGQLAMLAMLIAAGYEIVRRSAYPIEV